MKPFHALLTAGLLLLLLLAWISWQVPAGTARQGQPIPFPTSAPAGEQGSTSGMVVARIDLPAPGDLRSLAARLDIWEVHPDHLIAMLNQQEWQRLASAGYQLTLDQQKTGLVNQPLQKLPGQTAGIPGFACYRTVEETSADLASLAAEYPGLARWIDIGDSWEKSLPGGPPGFDLNALVLTNQSIPGPKPVFFLMAEIHARELVTAETAARFSEHLVQSYGLDPRITSLLDDYEIHIVPLTNPDGRKMAESGLYWRKNTDNDDGCPNPYSWGTDLNRNHSYHWGSASPFACDETYQGPAASSEPETRAIQNYMLSIFQDQRGPADSDPAPESSTGTMITLHSYGSLVLWPWGWTTNPAPNDSQLATLGRKLAYFNGYTAAQSINLYPTFGTSDDWAYGELGIAAYTFEMGTSFFQDCASFNNSIYPYNREALLYAVQSARRPYQNPSGPDSLAVQIDPPAVLIGGSAALSANADDTRYLPGSGQAYQMVAAARFSLDGPTWISPTTTLPMIPVDGSFDASQEHITATLDTSGLIPGRHIVFVESQDADGNWGVPGVGFICASEADFSPSLSAAATTRESLPGEQVVYHLRLDNLGTSWDSFDLKLSGAVWPTSIVVTPGSLGPCASKALKVEVSIPGDAFGNSSSTATLTATSQGDLARSVSLDLTTLIRLDYGIDIAPAQSILTSLPGETITHTIQITNRGNFTATYGVALTENLWPTDLPPASIALAPGDTLDLNLPVHIPADVALGSSDVARLDFQSQDFPEKQSTILLTTRAWWRYYFPFVGWEHRITGG